MEIEEIQLIDNTFSSIKSNILITFDLRNNFNRSVSYRESILYQGFSRIYNEIQTEINSLPFDKYILEKLDDLITVLETEFEIKKSSIKISPTLLSTRNKYWLTIKTLLSNTRKEISKEIYNEALSIDLPNEGLALNRAQIALLMIYLRKKKAIKDFNDSQLAIHFQALTGYSNKQLRLLIASDSKIEKNQITDKRDDFVKLKELLLSIISDIEQDISKAILK
jgi:hypothetical protein